MPDSIIPISHRHCQYQIPVAKRYHVANDTGSVPLVVPGDNHLRCPSTKRAAIVNPVETLLACLEAPYLGLLQVHRVGIRAITRAAGDVTDTSATKILCADSRTFLFFHTDKLLYLLFTLFLCYLPSKRLYYIFSTPIDLHLSSLLRIA